MPNISAVQRYLHTHIPISAHLGTRVLEAGAERVRLAAPLGPNLNHRQTAFGGSLSALAILAGWAWLWVSLDGERFGGRIVIQSSTMDYTAPADGDFEAVCAAPSAERWSHFLRMLADHRRARIELHADVLVQQQLVATFTGRYVALAG